MSFIHFSRSLRDFHLALGPFQFSYGLPVKSLDLPFFCAFKLFNYQLEIGEIDQGYPGIYLTRIGDDRCDTLVTILQIHREKSQ